jgi:hypothetical protein
MSTRQRPTSGLDRVTEIVPKFPPTPFLVSQPESGLGLTSLTTY